MSSISNNLQARSRPLALLIVVTLFLSLLAGLVPAKPAAAATYYYYRMIVTNSTGAPIYLTSAPWDGKPAESYCIDLNSIGLGWTQAITPGQSVTLAFNRSGLGKCDGEGGWLSLRASHNNYSTSDDYQQFQFSNDGALWKDGRTSSYQNTLSGSNGLYALSVESATDSGHDYYRFGWKMAVKNTTVSPIWVMAASDDQAKYGHFRSSCITPATTIGAKFAWQYPLQPGESINYYFNRSTACSGWNGWFSIRSSSELNSVGTDFQQFRFSNDGGYFEKYRVNASWPSTLSKVGLGNMSLTISGSEYIGGPTFRRNGYYWPESSRLPGRVNVTRSVNWNTNREEAILTFRTDFIGGAPVGLYRSCSYLFGEFKYWHTQAMVQLPSRNGRAYFARTDSYLNRGSFYVVETDADAYDAVNDGVKDTPGTDGAVVFLQEYSGRSHIGDWNHPGDMAVVGNILIIAGQQWYSDGYLYCELGTKGIGQDQDAALFYDVSNPVFPKYLGKITASEIGLSGRDAVSGVNLAKTKNGLWDLYIGGNSGQKHFRSTIPWP